MEGREAVFGVGWDFEVVWDLVVAAQEAKEVQERQLREC